MEKRAEIDLLDKTIRAFGEQSYIGPWLREYREHIVGQILDDVCVDVPLPKAARVQGETMVREAKLTAMAIVETATKQANATWEKETDRIANVRENLRNDLHKAMHTLADW